MAIGAGQTALINNRVAIGTQQITASLNSLIAGNIDNNAWEEALRCSRIIGDLGTDLLALYEESPQARKKMNEIYTASIFPIIRNHAMIETQAKINNAVAFIENDANNHLQAEKEKAVSSLVSQRVQLISFNTGTNEQINRSVVKVFSDYIYEKYTPDFNRINQKKRGQEFRGFTQLISLFQDNLYNPQEFRKAIHATDAAIQATAANRRQKIQGDDESGTGSIY